MMRARAFSCVFVRFRTVQYCTVQYELNKISRFYALTPKITYLGRFSNCMVRCSRKGAGRDPAPRGRMRREFCVCFSHATTKNGNDYLSTYLLFLSFESGIDQIGLQAGRLCSHIRNQFLGVFRPRREDIFVVSADKLAIYLSILF